MIGKLRALLRDSRLFSFNLVNRDAWIEKQATLLPPGAVVLDIGAGSCPYRDLFAHCRYMTQDVALLKGEQLRHGAYGQIDYVCDAADIPVESGHFDAVLCTEVLEHLSDPIRAVREFGRILKPGGRLILTAPLGSGIHQEPYHFYGGFTPYWYSRFLSEAGFTGIAIEANAGSFMSYSQESIRFIRMTRPFKLRMSVLIELFWMPVWILLAPLLGVFIPMACACLDRFDIERRFTVGYHVTADKI